MACLGVSLPAQQTAVPAATHQASAPATAVTLPPEPLAKVGSGDSAARAARALIYVARGEAALRAGMRDTARIAWEKALNENPQCTDAVVDFARVMVEDGDGLHAQELLSSALARDPTNPKLLHFKAHRIGAPPDSSER